MVRAKLFLLRYTMGRKGVVCTVDIFVGALLFFCLSGCTTISPSTYQLSPPGDDFALRQELLGDKNVSGSDLLGSLLLQRQNDADLYCRSPIYTNYIEDHYKFGELQRKAQCDSQLPVRIFSETNGEQIKLLDTNNVRSIHLLFFGGGAATESNFGHVALRLIVCPNRNSTDEECDRNLKDHLVLGFRAQILGFDVTIYDGLLGGYKTHLFVDPFMDIYRQYAISEFRDVFSVPINMTPLDREKMLRGLVNIHWQHENDYYFFTRNCVTLLQSSLLVLNDKYRLDPLANERYIRPDLFFEAAKNSQLFKGDVLHSLGDAEALGYFFPSTKAAYDSAFDYLSTMHEQNGISLDYRNTQEYWEASPGERIRKIADNKDLQQILILNQRLLKAYIILEEYSMLKHKSKMMQESYQLLLGDFDSLEERLSSSKNKIDSDFLESCFIDRLRNATVPAKRYREIPKAESIDNDFGKANIVCSTPESSSRIRSSLAASGFFNDDEWSKFNYHLGSWGETIKNVQYLKSFLRAEAHIN